MYLNMPRFTFSKKCAIVAAILMAAASGIASTDIPNADAPKTLKENIATPEVPKKYSPAIQRHMGNNANQFARHNLEVAMHRKNEVYSIIIPCDTLFKPNDDELRTHAPYYLNAFKECCANLRHTRYLSSYIQTTPAASNIAMTSPKDAPMLLLTISMNWQAMLKPTSHLTVWGLRNRARQTLLSRTGDETDASKFTLCPKITSLSEHVQALSTDNRASQLTIEQRIPKENF